MKIRVYRWILINLPRKSFSVDSNIPRKLLVWCLKSLSKLLVDLTKSSLSTSLLQQWPLHTEPANKIKKNNLNIIIKKT